VMSITSVIIDLNITEVTIASYWFSGLATRIED
jgi:hypothetical protein